jgi:hypothetical protein
MFIKKLVLGAVAAAMPLTALAAAPASAAQGGYRHHDNNPYVNVSAYGHNVKVEYKCYSDDHGDDYGHHGRHHDQYGTLTTHFRGYDNWYRVRCDGYKHWKNFDVYGHGDFKAVIKDGNGNYDYDSAYVNNDYDDHGGHY